MLSTNPNIFKINYSFLKLSALEINAEIITERFNPDNISKFSGWGFEVSELWSV
jgi:hypothetical protein